MQKEQTITLCRHFLSIIVRSEDIHKPYDQIFGYFDPPPSGATGCSVCSREGNISGKCKSLNNSKPKNHHFGQFSMKI